MHDPDPTPHSRRANFLSGLLGLIVLTAFLGLFFVICSGVWLYILAVVGGVAGIGFLHYLRWGHSLTEEVAGEREAAGEEETGPDDDWPEEPPRLPHRRF